MVNTKLNNKIYKDSLSNIVYSIKERVNCNYVKVASLVKNRILSQKTDKAFVNAQIEMINEDLIRVRNTIDSMNEISNSMAIKVNNGNNLIDNIEINTNNIAYFSRETLDEVEKNIDNKEDGYWCKILKFGSIFIAVSLILIYLIKHVD